ncbi:MAG TPA: methyltransferase domain-containing protein [Thermomicrobiales bacterium]|nr:methyltransferase domain-containing protein [Thermomicrobiales bacterium]
MATPDPRGAFSNIDQSADPAGFVRVLDALTALDFVQAYKRRTFEVLGLEPGVSVLDLGCGTGDDAQELARLVGPSGRVVGIDRSETVIAQARERAEETNLPVEFRVADADDLPFPDAMFDACRADRVFHHLEHPSRAFGELVRVARPGGRVLLFDPDFETAVVDAPDRAVTRRLLNHYCDGYRDGWMGRKLPGLFRAARLTEVTVEPVTVLLTDLVQANAVLALEDTVTRAVAAESVAEAAGAAWLDGLRTASEAGRFFAAISGFIVAGRKS